ncbi:MAG: tail fiber domain-containing protein, partial [Firmicutes bacterium]|nr:tail fiber domain-containing protein [Bacillota bacterium]
SNPNSILNLYGSNPEERILESTSIGTASVGLGDGVNNPAITSEGLRILYESSTGHSYIRNLWSAGKLFFDTAGSNTRMTIDQSGNIGIGTTAPAAKLDVTSSRISSDTQIGDFVAPGSTAGTGYVTFGNGFVGWDYGAGVLGINAHSAGGPGGGICIKRVDNGHSNIGILTANPSAPLSFRPATEQKIKLYDSGAGVDTYGFGVEPSELRIATSDGGYITFRTGYYNGAKMTLNNNGSLWTLSGYSQGSDIRLKKNISTVNEALDKVLKLRGVIFEWKTKEYKERGFPKGRHYGVIAQEIEKILPEIVNTDSKGEKSVAYTEIIPVLIEAVKEQQKEIAGLKEQQKAQQKQITELNAQNKLLEQRLSALEKSIKVKRR